MPVIDEAVLSSIDAKGVVYQREIEVNLEGRFLHWETLNSLRKLNQEGSIGARQYRGSKWYYRASWVQIKAVADRKCELVRAYTEFPNREKRNGEVFDDYSEFLVAEALVLSGFRIIGRNLGRGPKKETELDFLVEDSLTTARYGLSVKNRLGYPTRTSIQSFLKLCKQHDVDPLLIVRQAPPSIQSLVARGGGNVVAFHSWMLRPDCPNTLSRALTEDLGIPIGIYDHPPDFLVRMLRTVRERI